MNVTEKQMVAYVEALHETLESRSEKYLGRANSPWVWRNRLTPAEITCYVSTQYGVAIEYKRADKTRIQTFRGSARVEDLLFQPPRGSKANPRYREGSAAIRLKDSQEFKISSCKFTNYFPVRLEGERSDVTLIDVIADSPESSWVRKVEYAEIYGCRNAARWTVEAARSKAKDEVLVALSEFKSSEASPPEPALGIREGHKKDVLVLGSYSAEGISRLCALSLSLRAAGYRPVKVGDIPDFEQFSLAQKVVALGSASRFIVLDDSEPAGQLNEFELCKNIGWVTAVLHAEGQRGSTMTKGAALQSAAMQEFNYDPSHPAPCIKSVVEWAETKLKNAKEIWNKEYSHRR